MDQNEFCKKLVERYVQNTANLDELELFFQFLKEGKLDEYLSEEMIKETENAGKVHTAPVRRMSAALRFAAASVIIIILAGFFYLMNNGSGPVDIVQNQKTPAIPKNDIAPGGNKAVLTLADGSAIVLDSARNGILSEQGNAQVIKLQNGKLAYQEGEKNAAASTVQYNTITTPRGGQYQVQLPDGTNVWLNAASSITFPTAFTGDNRDVKITGEAYFEVTQNTSKPFRVMVNTMEVQVIGTHFNVNAYEDEAQIRTTLLEGRVKVTEGSNSVMMTPGEQARLDISDGKIRVKKDMNLDEVIAWKNGLFQFHQAGIRTIMRQIARWYDVTVVIEEGVPDKKFDGKIYRNVNASEVLRILEEGGIHIDIDGQKVVVSP